MNGTISNDAYILWKIYHCDIVINYFSCGSKQIRPLIGTVRYLINEQDGINAEEGISKNRVQKVLNQNKIHKIKQEEGI